MALCIPSPMVEKIKEALVSGGLSLQGLYEMKSSEERQAAFEKYVHPDLARFITGKFEKAAASKNANALTDFVKEISTEKEKKSGKTKSIIERIGKIKEADLLNPDSQTATFTDLFSDMLGIKVSVEQMKNLSAKADKIEALQEKVVEAENSDAPAKEWLEGLEKARSPYHAALDEMDTYINTQTPASIEKNITGGIFRANMLTALPAAVVNQISNFVQGFMQAAERRIASKQFSGVSAGVLSAYLKMGMNIYQKSGYGISRKYSEHTKFGERILHAEGPGFVRAINRKLQKIVYHYMLGAADEASALFARADSALLQVADITGNAELTGDALEIFKDSMRLEPQTKAGVIVQAQSIADAERATWTNKTWASETALKFRDWLNDATGDFQLGYWTNPFVKTAANVLQFGIDSSIFGFGQPLYKFNAAWKAMNSKVAPDPKPMQDVIRLAVRAGMGTTLTLIFSALIPPDDFIGAYDQLSQKQRDMRGLKKGVYNAVKIGGKWISLDYFGALGSGFVGMMYARKYGKGIGDMAFQYARGAGGQALNVPGIQNFAELYSSLTDALKKDTPGAGIGGLAVDAYNTIAGRTIPGIVSTVAKAIDPVERQLSKGLLDRTKAGIPGWRQTLPAKIDRTTGLPVLSESFLTTMLFGSRVRTANESRLIDEITRLDSVGFAPAISDIERSSSRVKELKAQLSDVAFQSALKYFGREYGKRASRLISTIAYRRADAEDKKKKLDSIRNDVRSEMLRKFRYRKPKNRGLKIK